jgi:hypothetical protein
MNTIFFYMYLITLILITTAYILSRCIFDYHYLDIFFYTNHNNNILENYVYLISHILVNYFLGLLFGLEIIYGMILKIILFEAMLYATERCDIFNTTKVSTLIIIIIISVVSYSLGSITKLIFSK